jgi:cupin 2 domain-containing protein
MNEGNLFEEIPGEMPEELTEVLARGQGKMRVERIVSREHASADGFWYEQAEEEFVVLLKGEAVLRFEESEDQRSEIGGQRSEDGEQRSEVRSRRSVRESGGTMEMKPGDWVHIPAGCRHRVERTAQGGEETVWLAVFFEEASGNTHDPIDPSLCSRSA